MTDKIANAFEAAARSLRTIVAPVVDENDSLAAEQLRVVVGILDFYRDRIGYEYPRKAYELSVYCTLAERLLGEFPTTSAGLAAALTSARAVADRPLADYSALDRAVSELTREIGEFTHAAWADGVGIGIAAGRIVLTESHRLIDLRRSWFLPQGGDPDPDTVLPLASLLALESEDLTASISEE